MYSTLEIQKYATETFRRPPNLHNRHDSLDAIRAVALLWVLSTHAYIDLPKKSTSTDTVLYNYVNYGFEGRLDFIHIDILINFRILIL